MPRTIRAYIPGSVYHLIARFVNEQWFIQSAEERRRYLHLLGVALSTSDWRCLAYAVMSNHIHLLMIAGATALSSWIRAVHSPFAGWINYRSGRIGPVFVRGPKDHGVEPHNVAKAIAYLHNNPVRAGTARRARNSTWTSHRAYVGLTATPAWLDVSGGLARSGFSDPEEFERWLDHAPSERPDIDLSKIRIAARRHGAIELGTPTAGETNKAPLLARRWAHLRIDPRRVVEATAAELQLSRLELCSRRRTPAFVIARVVVVHCGIALGLTVADLAAALGVSHQAGSAMLRRKIEAPNLIAAYERVYARLAAEIGA
ncbi:MAG: transposase [Kofleriaceae bacterium]